jgi:hypothetical protein
MPEPMIATTAMHPITMTLPCGRHVWFSAQKLMLAHSLLVLQVPLWILFHSASCVVFSACTFVGATVVVSRFPKCMVAGHGDSLFALCLAFHALFACFAQ